VYEVSAEAGVARLAYGPLGDHTYTPSFAAFLAGVFVCVCVCGCVCACAHVRMCVGAGCCLSCHHGLHVSLWLLAFVLWREDMCVGCTVGVAYVLFGVATFPTHDSTACCPRSSIRGLLFLALYVLVFLCRCVHQAAQLDASPLLSALSLCFLCACGMC
jgi:hypothetical protein